MRVSLLALALAAGLLAAGCLGSPATTAGLEGAAPPAADAGAAATIVDARGGMGEPSLGITPDGVLFTTGRDQDGLIESGAAYRSRDGGATWENVGAPTAPFPNFDPDLAVDADGTVWWNVLYLGCNAVAVSEDQGETWAMNPAVCNGPVGDRQYVIPTKGGTAYLYYHQVPTFQQTGMKTTDYGRTWLPTGPMEAPGHHLLLTEGSGWGGGGFWNPTTDSVFATFTWFTGSDVLGGGTWAPAFTATRDGGATWQVGTLPNMGGRSHGLSLVVGAADEAGNVYLAWSETSDEDDSAVYLAASRDDGRTWGEPLRVDVDARSNVFPAIATGAAGEVALAYYEADEAGYPSDVSEDARWDVALAWTRDAFAPAVAWERATLTTGPAKEGPICPDGASCDGDRQLLDYFALKRLPDGRLASVWTSTEDVEGKTVNVFAATPAPALSAWASAPREE